jgi:hypothetical protein
MLNLNVLIQELKEVTLKKKSPIKKKMRILKN